MSLLYIWFNPPYYSDKIFPDIYVAFFYTAAIFIVYHQKKNNSRQYFDGILLALVLFLAILAKETIILTIPVFVYLALTDIFQKRNFRFWLVSICSLVLVMSLYLVFIKIQTGHFFQRYYAIKAQSYFNPCSYDQLPFSETLRRISSSLWLAFIRSGMFWLLIFGMTAVAERRAKSLIKVSSPEDFFPMVFILTILCCDLMSTSVTHYIPMCDDSRHFIFLVPIAAIAAAKGMILFFRSPTRYWGLIIVMCFACYLSLHFGYENRYIVYLPWLVVMVIALILISRTQDGEAKEKTHIASKSILGLSVAGILLAQPIQGFLYARSMGYRFQKQLVMQNIKGLTVKTVVITNFVERNFGPYYLSYDTSHVIFMSFQDIKAKGIPPDRKILLLLDGFSSTVGSQKWEDLPAYAQSTKGYKLIDKINGAELYELNAQDIITTAP